MKNIGEKVSVVHNINKQVSNRTGQLEMTFFLANQVQIDTIG